MQVQRVQNNNYNTSFGVRSIIINKVNNSLKSIGKQTVSNVKDEFVSLRQIRKSAVYEYLAKRGHREMCPMISREEIHLNVEH